MRVLPSEVQLEFAAQDGSDRSPIFSDDPVIRALQTDAHKKARRYIARLSVRNQLLWEIELDKQDRKQAKELILRDIQRQAPTVDVGALKQVLADELQWPEESAIALTIAFLFPMIPNRLLGWRSADPEKPRGPGRPEIADSLTRQIWQLLNAWIFITGRKPRTSRRTLFARAVGVAAEYLPIHIRYRREPVVAAADDIHRIIQREVKRMTSGRFIMVPPPRSPR